ncbi:MAG: amidase, partial [Myxococcales bacterium]|nr:amidase [Myxococcales bacterium]
MGGFPEFGQYDALGLADLVRRKEVSPLELVDEAIVRIDRVDTQLHAVVVRAFDQARTRAREKLGSGPLAGVPFLLKDLGCDWEGIRHSFGSRFASSYVSEADGELSARYRRAGLVVLGRTHSSEFGLLPVGESQLYGITENPWMLGRTAAGSSAGAGAIVGARALPIAHAADGGGSIRAPAAAAGVFGMKPTRSRTPIGPDMSEFWQGFAIHHAISVSVRDCAALLDVSHGPEVGAFCTAPPPKRPYRKELERDPKPLRIGFTAKPFLPSRVHPDCVAAVDDAARLCESLGHDVQEMTVPVSPQAFAEDLLITICADTAAWIRYGEKTLGRRAQQHELEKTTWFLRYVGESAAAVRMCEARNNLLEQTRRIQKEMVDRKIDVLLTPTLGSPPVPHGTVTPRGLEKLGLEVLVAGRLKAAVRLPGLVSKLAEDLFDFLPFTPLANVSGQPSMNVPLHWNAEGLPVGTMFTGHYGKEGKLYRLAAQLERARPWREKKPP